MKHAAAAVALAACALATFVLCAPLYFTNLGFPLDDAWIHAVYARELARSGLLAFNPGVAATGESSPLWAFILAGAHAVGTPGTAVFLTKTIGVVLHAASVAVMALAMNRAGVEKPLLASAGAGLAAIHPDLVAASASGMEVPLAAALIAGVVLASVEAKRLALCVLGAACFLGRPESAAVAVLFPLLLWGSRAPRTALLLSSTAFAGVLVAVALTAGYNLAVWGRPLPATFYAKAAASNAAVLAWQVFGFREVLGAMPLAHPIVILVGVALALVLAVSRHAGTAGRMGAALLLSGVAFCIVSFALVHPYDPGAFYHQRYVIPALLPIVAALPLVAWELVARAQFRGRAIVDAVAVLALMLVLATASPARYRWLQNDAQNVDDVQVALGRALATAPASFNAWVIDAGAVRFFGNAFVVDMVGLNTPELLTDGAEGFLERHPPGYLDAFPGWSRVEAEPPFETRTFATTTRYTVTHVPSMRQHSLVTCRPGASGDFIVRQRTFPFRCAS